MILDYIVILFHIKYITSNKKNIIINYYFVNINIMKSKYKRWYALIGHGFYTVWNGYYGKMLKVGDTVRNGIYGKIPFKKLPIFRNGLRRSRTVSDYIWFWLRYSKER